MTYQQYLDREPVILTVAPTGGVHGKETNPNVPEQPEEIAKQVRECEKLGASIAHLHARDRHGENSAARLQEVNDAVRDRCENIIVQNTTGGQSVFEERVKGIRTDPAPEMASLDMGPFNRGDHIITNHSTHNIERLAGEMQSKGIVPEFECFNNSHLQAVSSLIDEGLVDPPYYVNLIFGGRVFSPPTPRSVMDLVDHLPEGGMFNVLATGPHQLPLTTLAVILGGHVRVGMEDNLYYRQGEPVKSNAQLVERTVAILDRLDREIATPDEAREILGIRKR